MESPERSFRRGEPVKAPTDDQLAFFDLEMQPLRYGDAGLTYQEQFDQFHARNPWVYGALVELARDLKRRGRRKIGMKMLFEVLRWTYYRTTDDPDSDFKLNNNLHSRYSRLIMQKEPDLADLFETRNLRSS
jgi:hypothetical protein